MDVPPRAGVGIYIKERDGVRRDAGTPNGSNKEHESHDERTVRT